MMYRPALGYCCWLTQHLTIFTYLATLTTSNYYYQNVEATSMSMGDDLDLFKITWHGPVKSSRFRDKFPHFDDDQNAHTKGLIQIATSDNERYVCIDPPLNNEDGLGFDSSAKNASSDKSKSPIQLLEPLLRGNFCSYKFELFWIYELCHGKFLRQYHEENSKHKAKVTQEYYLGKMEQDQIKLHEEEYIRETEELARTGQSRPTIIVNGVHKPYVVFNMTSGTRCDLTKKSRVSRIVYVCNEEPSLDLYSIKEIATCEYEAIVLSPHLCQHKDFKIDTATQHEIKCYALDDSPQKPKRVQEFHGNDDDETNGHDGKAGVKRRGIAYLQGRTLIIDANLLLS